MKRGLLKWMAGSVLVLGALLLLVWGLYLAVSPITHRGKTVDEWISQLCNAPDYGRRENGATALVEIGRPAVDSIVAALERKPGANDSWWVKLWRKIPAEIRARLPNPLPQELRDKRDLFEVLARIGSPSDKIIDALAAGLRHSDSEMRFFALNAFRELDTGHAEKAVPILIDCLDDSAGNVRSAAAYALASLGPGAEEAIPHLVKYLSDEERNGERWTAAKALGQINVDSERVIEALTARLDDRDPVCRGYSAWALWNITGRTEAPLRAMESIWAAGETDAYASALSRLQKMGQEARPLLPQVREMLSHKDQYIQIHAARCIWKIQNDANEALPVLIKGLQSKERSDRIRATMYVELLGAEARKAVPTLMSIVADDSDWIVRRNAATALGQISGGSPKVVQVLQGCVEEDPIFEVRKAAREALEEIRARNGPTSSKDLKP